jgi:hypothetical protein
MRESLELGPTPCDEDCAQVGMEDYFAKARPECRRYIDLLVKKFGKPLGEAYFYIKSNPHEFGSYLEVAIKFNTNSREETAFAYHVESNLPAKWTDEAEIPLDMATFDE